MPCSSAFSLSKFPFLRYHYPLSGVLRLTPFVTAILYQACCSACVRAFLMLLLTTPTFTRDATS